MIPNRAIGVRGGSRSEEPQRREERKDIAGNGTRMNTDHHRFGSRTAEPTSVFDRRHRGIGSSLRMRAIGALIRSPRPATPMAQRPRLGAAVLHHSPARRCWVDFTDSRSSSSVAVDFCRRKRTVRTVSIRSEIKNEGFQEFDHAATKLKLDQGTERHLKGKSVPIRVNPCPILRWIFAFFFGMTCLPDRVRPGPPGLPLWSGSLTSACAPAGALQLTDVSETL